MDSRFSRKQLVLKIEQGVTRNGWAVSRLRFSITQNRLRILPLPSIHIPDATVAMMVLDGSVDGVKSSAEPGFMPPVKRGLRADGALQLAPRGGRAADHVIAVSRPI